MFKGVAAGIGFAFFLCSLAGCGSGGGSGDGSGGSGDRTQQGGDTTSSDRGALAFEHPAPNLDGDGDEMHALGDKNFGAKFVTPPSPVNAGLGPVFNNNSCDACHTKNGRGQLIFGSGGQGSQALVRLSLPAGEPPVPGGSVPVTGFGTQLQDHANFGVAPEASVSLSFETINGKYGDGTAYQLRKPQVRLKAAGGRTLPSNVLTSLRTAPPVFGIGLLEAVPEAEIVALADPDDADQDGISGRPNYVWDPEQQKTVLGRFGRKANNSTVRDQIASAYAEDIGVTNPVFPAEDGSTEIDEATLKSVEFYVQTLGIPAAANPSAPTVQRGEELFQSFQCASCHVPQLQTGPHPVAAVANQTIFPYTDLLLHDMGAGLADNRPDFQASGTEWRTPPLWGIGVTATILSSTANFLHDGRARSLEEAILWHGGEAEHAKESFRTAAPADRQALIEFLRSL
jgi:CxxC motif-containing protein (DUF1111 family)